MYQHDRCMSGTVSSQQEKAHTPIYQSTGVRAGRYHVIWSTPCVVQWGPETDIQLTGSTLKRVHTDRPHPPPALFIEKQYSHQSPPQQEGVRTSATSLKGEMASHPAAFSQGRPAHPAKPPE